MALMAETTRMIVSSLDMDEVLNQVLNRVVALIGVEAGSIALMEESSGDLVFRSATGPKSASIKDLRLKPGQGVAGWVAQNGRPLVVAGYAPGRPLLRQNRRADRVHHPGHRLRSDPPAR